MKEEYIAPTYWLLFIVLPTVVACGIVVTHSIPKWVLAVVIALLLVVGEHGLRKWATIVAPENSNK